MRAIIYTDPNKMYILQQKMKANAAYTTFAFVSRKLAFHVAY